MVNEAEQIEVELERMDADMAALVDWMRHAEEMYASLFAERGQAS
jgi:hypothetical protein